jgi:hypothetical protein
MNRNALSIVGFFLLMLTSVNAQETGSFIIKKVGNGYKPTGSDINKSYNIIEVKVEDIPGNIKVGIFTSELKNPVFENKKFGKNEGDIPIGIDGSLKITILNDYKIKECPEIIKEVPDKFLLKVNESVIGPFLLDSKVKPELPKLPSQGNYPEKPKYKTGFLSYDAIYLNENWNNQANIDTIKLILQNYSINNSSDLDNNPFLKVAFKGLYDIKVKVVGVHGGEGLGKADLLSGIGGLDVTNFADGMARFMVERAKTELNVFFFDKFRDRLDSTIELRILFPNTYQQLRIIGSEIYNYNAYITSLRESFEKDLAALFVNLPKLMDDKKYERAFDDIPELRLILKSSFYIISQLNNDVHPGDIIHEFPKEFGKDIFPDNFYNSIKVLDLFSQSILSKDKSKYWIGTDTLTLLLNEKTFRIFMGLIYQNTSDNIVFTTNSGPINFKSDVLKPFGSGWNAIDDKVNKYKEYIRDFGSKVDAINVSLKGIKSKSKDGKGSYNDIYIFINASLDFFDYTVSFGKLPYIKEKVEKSSFFNFYYKYSFVARQGSDLYLNINNRDYGLAILNVINISDTVFTSKIIHNTAVGIVEKHSTIIDAEMIKNDNERQALEKKIKVEKEEKKIKELNQDLDVVSKKSDKLKQQQEKLTPARKTELINEYSNAIESTKKWVLKYGTFMANITNAKSSQEVESIIESVAMPAGSSRIKRVSKVNIALNSYLGLYVGHEFIEGVTNWPVINNYAVSAPIGVSFTWGGLKCKPKSAGWGIGGFISVIDIGALASFRITANDSVDVAPNIKLQDIIAPGAFFTLNFPKSPFTLAIGAQVGPLLRSVDESSHEVAKNAYWRLGMTLTVDIPLLNIYNQEKRKKN